MSVAFLAVIAVYSSSLFLVVTSAFVLYGFFRWIFFAPLRQLTEDQIGNSSRQVSELLEALRGIVPIKLANQQETRRTRYENAVVRTTNQDVGVQRPTISFSAANELVFGLMRIALVFIAARQVMAGAMAAGVLVAIVAYADQFSTRASALIDCGKTTLAKILLGLIEPTEGQVFFGAIPLGRLGLERYRDHVAAVMQDDQLFAGSIRDNITFGSEDTGFDDVIEAARAAAIDKDISAMPLGYNTNVGDMGASLSGGPKQRVILARALYRKPKLFLLDEATSHLDLQNEAMVEQSVAALAAARIVIAHRPQTVASADAVVNLGTTKLLTKKGEDLDA